MPRPEDTLIAEDFERAVGLIEELHDAGRIDEATAVYKLIVAVEQAGLRPSVAIDLTDDDLDALERADEEIAAGKIVPHDVMLQGAEAVAAYVRRRNSGDVDPDVAAVVERYRREWEAGRSAARRA